MITHFCSDKEKFCHFIDPDVVKPPQSVCRCRSHYFGVLKEYASKCSTDVACQTLLLWRSLTESDINLISQAKVNLVSFADGKYVFVYPFKPSFSRLSFSYLTGNFIQINQVLQSSRKRNVRITNK